MRYSTNIIYLCWAEWMKPSRAEPSEKGGWFFEATGWGPTSRWHVRQGRAHVMWTEQPETAEPSGAEWARGQRSLPKDRKRERERRWWVRSTLLSKFPVPSDNDSDWTRFLSSPFYQNTPAPISLCLSQLLFFFLLSCSFLFLYFFFSLVDVKWYVSCVDP